MKITLNESNTDREVHRLETEEAWDASDEVVEVRAKRPLDKVIPVRLESKDWDRLRVIANEIGVGPSTLARIWILERLRPAKGGKRQQ